MKKIGTHKKQWHCLFSLSRHLNWIWVCLHGCHHLQLYFMKCAWSCSVYIINFDPLPAVLVLFYPCCCWMLTSGSHGLNHAQSLECKSKINVNHFVSFFYFIYIILLLKSLKLKNNFIMWEWQQTPKTNVCKIVQMLFIRFYLSFILSSQVYKHVLMRI